jgi:hypothetical protein
MPGAAVFSKRAPLRSPARGEAGSPAPLRRWPQASGGPEDDPDTAFPAIEPLRPPRVRRMTGPVGAMTYVVAARFIRAG